MPLNHRRGWANTGAHLDFRSYLLLPAGLRAREATLTSCEIPCESGVCAGPKWKALDKKLPFAPTRHD